MQTDQESTPLKKTEVTQLVQLSNGLYAAIGRSRQDGVSIDIYKDRSMKHRLLHDFGFEKEPQDPALIQIAEQLSAVLDTEIHMGE